MKKIYILFVILLAGRLAISQTAFIEKFQGGTIPATFTLINDNNTVNAQITSMFPDAWNVISEPSDTSNKVAGSPSYFDAVATADRWMITPAISVAANMTLSWAGKAQDVNYLDGYSVKISTTGKNKADFTTTVATISAETGGWSYRNYDLSALAGQTIYVAFIQNSTDMFYIMIDDIRVGVGTSIDDNVPTVSSVNISPNPAKDQLTVNATSNINNIKIINSLGQVVSEQIVDNNQITVDISALESGIYFVTTETKQGTFTEKVIVL